MRNSAGRISMRKGGTDAYATSTVLRKSAAPAYLFLMFPCERAVTYSLGSSHTHEQNSGRITRFSNLNLLRFLHRE